MKVGRRKSDLLTPNGVNWGRIVRIVLLISAIFFGGHKGGDAIVALGQELSRELD